jgi:hypothetical protein
MAFTETQSVYGDPQNYNVVLGLQSTADWSDPNYIPGDWREAILRFFPNGDAPLTAMLAKLPSEKTDDVVFNWWTEGLADQHTNITSVYTDAAMTMAYTAGSAAKGDVLYLKCPAAESTGNPGTAGIREFRPGHTINLRCVDNANNNANPYYGTDTVAIVLSSTPNGANSQLAVQLLESANDSATYPFDYCLIIGNANEQGSDNVQSISYQPVRDFNYTQIFRTPLEITGTAMAQKTRIGDWYQHEKQNCLRYHSIEIEKALLWGIPYVGTGPNGKPLYTTCGLTRKIVTNKYDYASSTKYSGKTWVQSGEDWILDSLAALFKYGSDERLCYAGTGAINAFSRIARANSQIQTKMGQAEYGITIMSYIMPFGTIHMKRHPLFSYEPVDQYSMILMEPKNLRWRYLKGRDTHYRPDVLWDKGGWVDRDAIKEGYITEGGLEMNIEPTFGYFTSVGRDNNM